MCVFSDTLPTDRGSESMRRSAVDCARLRLLGDTLGDSPMPEDCRDDQEQFQSEVEQRLRSDLLRYRHHAREDDSGVRRSCIS